MMYNVFREVQNTPFWFVEPKFNMNVKQRRNDSEQPLTEFSIS